MTIVPLTWPIGSGVDFQGVYEMEQGAGPPVRTLRTQRPPRRPGGQGPRGRRARQAARHCRPRAPARRTRDGRRVHHALRSGAVPRGRDLTDVLRQRAHELRRRDRAARTSSISAPPPGPLSNSSMAWCRPEEDFFSGFVYKVAANMDKHHRDRIAFLRVTSGRFERGMAAKHVRLGREVRLSHPPPILRAGAGDHR